MSLLEKATIITTPTAHSNGKLHSIKGGSVADFDVVRGSAATRVNAEGLIESVAANIPRIDYTTGEGVILTEPQSTNLLPYSEAFTSGEWKTLVGTTPTLEGGYLAPDGTSTAFKISNANRDSTWQYEVTPNLTTTSSRSIYARTVSGSGTAQLLSHSSNTNNTFTITEQWQRFDVSSANSTGTRFFYAVDFRGGATLNEIIVWGAQAEDLPYSTSYIPTSGAIATRLADEVTGAGDATTFNSTEGVLYAEIAALTDDNTFRSIALSDGTNNNRVVILYNDTSGIRVVIFRNNVLQVVLNNTINVTDTNKIAVKYELNEVDFWINGVKVSTDTNALMPIGLNELSFSRGDGGLPFYGKTKTIAVFSEALTDEELTCLTTI